MKMRLLLPFIVVMAVAASASVSAQTQSSSDPKRASTYSEQAVQSAQRFLEQYPDSDYAPIIREYLKQITEQLALSDFQVAQFYGSRANYVAAKDRLKKVIDKYPDFSHIEEAKQLYKIFDALSRN